MKSRILIFAALLGVYALLTGVQSCTKDAELAMLEPDLSEEEINFRGSGQLSSIELLGKQIFFDKISAPNNMSCATCHAPAYGFTGPNSGINKKHGIYPGAIKTRFGNRKPPSAAYATASPILHYQGGLFIGGNFWDGRATGERLESPAAEQALGPFLNHVEQNMPSKEAVLREIAASNYADLWEEVWGAPVSWARKDLEENYDRIGLSIAAYEASPEVNAFSSKYDRYLKGQANFTAQELEGMALFEGKGQCALCHPAPLFTDFSYDNLGVPRNPNNPWYKMDQEYIDGEPINPEGSAWIDYGLGGFLQSVTNANWKSKADANLGKHKVPTLRNVDKRPSSSNTKAYMHNGVFKSLEEVVHFYNTRDVGNWPPPEVSQNVNTAELGDLGLTAKEEAAIVAFMKTLSDGYR